VSYFPSFLLDPSLFSTTHRSVGTASPESRIPPGSPFFFFIRLLPVGTVPFHFTVSYTPVACPSGSLFCQCSKSPIAPTETRFCSHFPAHPKLTVRRFFLTPFVPVSQTLFFPPYRYRAIVQIGRSILPQFSSLKGKVTKRSVLFKRVALFAPLGVASPYMPPPKGLLSHFMEMSRLSPIHFPQRCPFYKALRH